MKKYLILGLTASLAIGGISYGCSNKDKDGTTDTTMGDSNNEIGSVDEATIPMSQPTTLKVFIDASGSMRDYFGKQNIGTIADALTSLNKAVESLDAEYYVWGDATNSIPQDEVTKRLIAKNLNGKASNFDVIFDEMTKMAGTDTLTVLISDGILSSASSKTNLSGQFTDYDKGILTNKIEKALKGKGKAVSVYRMMGNFNGIYYNKANGRVAYTGERPFFVFVLGNPENVRDFDVRAHKGSIHELYKKAESIHIGTAPDMDSQIEVVDGNASMAEGSDFDRAGDSFDYSYAGTQAFRLYAKLPKWIRDTYPVDVIKRMSEVEVEDDKLNIPVTIQNGAIYFDIPQKMVEKYQNEGKKWTIEYTMSDPALKDWERYSTDDDTTPDAETTYLLKDLVKAIHDGVVDGSEELLKSKISVTRQ